MTKPTSTPFWQQPLSEIEPANWEKICDGCGRCCVIRFEDEDSGEIIESSYGCKFLDFGSCQCTDYAKRFVNVPDCLQVTVELLENVQTRRLMPYTCSYRVLAETGDLPEWHPLKTGDANSVVDAGAGMQGMLESEENMPDEIYIDCDEEDCNHDHGNDEHSQEDHKP